MKDKKNKIIILLGIINIIIGLIMIPKSYYTLYSIIDIKSNLELVKTTNIFWAYLGLFILIPLKLFLIPIVRCIAGYGLAFLKYWSRKLLLIISSLNLVINLTLVIHFFIWSSNYITNYTSPDVYRGIRQTLTFTSEYFMIAFDLIIILYLILPGIRKKFIHIKNNNGSIKFITVIQKIKSKLNLRNIFKSFLFIIIGLIIIIILSILSSLSVHLFKKKINRDNIKKFTILYSGTSHGKALDIFYHGYLSNEIKIPKRKNYYLTVTLECAFNPKNNKLIVTLNQKPSNKTIYPSVRDELIFIRKLKDKFLSQKVTEKVFIKYKSIYPKVSPVPNDD